MITLCLNGIHHRFTIKWQSPHAPHRATNMDVIYFHVRINCCLGGKNEKCLKLTAEIVDMIDRDLLSSIPTETVLPADTDQCHMYSHGCAISWLRSRMSPISYVIALPPACWRKILTHSTLNSTYCYLLWIIFTGHECSHVMVNIIQVKGTFEARQQLKSWDHFINSLSVVRWMEHVTLIVSI